MDRKFILSLAVFASLFYGVSVYAAPVSNIFRNIMPEADNTYEIGTSTLRWKKIWATDIDSSLMTIGALNPGDLNVLGCGKFGTTSTTTICGNNALSTIDGNLTVEGDLDVDGLTSALTLTGSTGIFAEYTGTTCTNQFVRVLSALGVATCETVGSADVAGLDISADTNLTAGDGITLTDDDLDCDTASGTVFGCLASADWTTFNNKESALTFSTGLTRSVNTITVDQSFSPTWTGNHIFNSITRSTTTQATSTNLFSGFFNANQLRVGGSATTTIDTAGNTVLPTGATLTVTDLTSALTLTGASGIFAEYTGTTCTNQFVRVLSALGVATCATVVAGDVDLADLTATNATLTFSGTYDGQTARTIGLNLANANTWTGGQTFTSATSTNFY